MVNPPFCLLTCYIHRQPPCLNRQRSVVSSNRGSVPEAAFAKDLAGNYDETRWNRHGFLSNTKTWKLMFFCLRKVKVMFFSCQVEDSFLLLYIFWCICDISWICIRYCNIVLYMHASNYIHRRYIGTEVYLNVDLPCIHIRIL